MGFRPADVARPGAVGADVAPPGAVGIAPLSGELEYLEGDEQPAPRITLHRWRGARSRPKGPVWTHPGHTVDVRAFAHPWVDGCYF
jgi:hypothetical protein